METDSCDFRNEREEVNELLEEHSRPRNNKERRRSFRLLVLRGCEECIKLPPPCVGLIITTTCTTNLKNNLTFVAEKTFQKEVSKALSAS